MGPLLPGTGRVPPGPGRPFAPVGHIGPAPLGLSGHGSTLSPMRGPGKDRSLGLVRHLSNRHRSDQRRSGQGRSGRHRSDSDGPGSRLWAVVSCRP